jgi:predicted CXXCH cytochrome family protein
MKSGRIGAPREIVNPAKLDPDRRDSVCAQCHLSGEVSVVKARSFQPGERIADYLTVFVRSGGSAGMKVTSHFEKLSQSACKRASGDRMWCGTCHDPHSPPGELRKKCLNCHEPAACKERPAVRLQRKDDCIGCHMPRNPVADVEHAVYTDHSIPKLPRSAPAAATRDLTLVPFGGSKASTRDLALAYASLAAPGDQPRIRKLLLAAQAEAPDDVEVLLHLAYLSNHDEAIPMYEQVLRTDPSQVVAAVNLGSVLMKRGQVTRAIALWKDALARSPGLEGATLNLASAQFRAGDLAAAEATLVKALGLNPDNTLARKLLGEVRQARVNDNH